MVRADPIGHSSPTLGDEITSIGGLASIVNGGVETANVVRPAWSRATTFTCAAALGVVGTHYRRVPCREATGTSEPGRNGPFAEEETETSKALGPPTPPHAVHSMTTGVRRKTRSGPAGFTSDTTSRGHTRIQVFVVVPSLLFGESGLNAAVSACSPTESRLPASGGT